MPTSSDGRADALALRVRNLGKRYYIGAFRPRYRTLRETLVDGLLTPGRRVWRLMHGQATGAADLDRELWALRGVSFEVRRGEVVGVIGRNGAGKTTLLKLLSRITEPTEGEGEIFGRVGSLLEVGTGFHPELTGRENIYLNGAILGMKRREIDRRFEEIVGFAEVEKFVDTPVKHFSSGMYVRLAFAVAAHLDPEVLLVDEVLAVGDVAFQKKCLGKMGDVARGGRTVLFVSHNMAAIQSFSERVLLLEQGRITRDGAPEPTIRHYLEEIIEPYVRTAPLAERGDRSGNGRVRLTSFHVEDAAGERLQVVRSGMDIALVFGFVCPGSERPRDVDVGFSVHSSEGATLFRVYSSYTGTEIEELPPRGAFRCRLNDLALTPGSYLVHARITAGGIEADWPRDGVGYLTVEEGDYFGTGQQRRHSRDQPLFLVRGQWRVEA